MAAWRGACGGVGGRARCWVAGRRWKCGMKCVCGWSEGERGVRRKWRNEREKGKNDLKRSREASERVCSIAFMQRRAKYGGVLMHTRAYGESELEHTMRYA